MDLEIFARNILFATKLEDKLVSLPANFSENSGDDRKTKALGVEEIPVSPGRPSRLARPGKVRFPQQSDLKNASARGAVLHFFANHELLAMEIMALVLLRFPEAPAAFRQGLAHTIMDEQNHLRLYIDRMRELSMDFGDLPTSDYFWNVMKNVRSPLEFVVQMSLTFEQANLDYSLYFMNAVASVGDEKTAAILERVYREEIAHVKHGVTWFNRWRQEVGATPEDDWDAYVRLLPPPMTPRRAKGFGFCVEARRQAGFSERFIRELKLCNSSKGRPPVVWIYNPHCESEIARGRPGYTASQGAREISEDLEVLPGFLAQSSDLVLVNKRPSLSWLESLRDIGFESPEWVAVKSKNIADSVRAPKLSGIEPWGWSSYVAAMLRPLSEKLIETDAGNAAFGKKLFAYEDFRSAPLGKFYAKTWSVAFLRGWMEQNPAAHASFGTMDDVGSVFTSAEDARAYVLQQLADDHLVMLKAPLGASGMQVREVRAPHELNGTLKGWIEKTITTQGAIVAERLLDKVCDLSFQMEVKDDRIRLLEPRRFLTGSRHEYRGTWLGHKYFGLTPEALKFLYGVEDTWRSLVRSVGERLREEGYRGPAGIDALLWRDQNDSLKLKPLVELNPRWTMGRVALELEKFLAPGTQAFWSFTSVREASERGHKNLESFAKELQQRYPLQTVDVGEKTRVRSGVVYTNDPTRATRVLTILAVLPNQDVAP